MLVSKFNNLNIYIKMFYIYIIYLIVIFKIVNGNWINNYDWD
jgi:hypothetical protein